MVVVGIVVLGTLFVITPLVAVIALLVLAPMRTLIATESTFPLPLDIGQLLFAILCLVWIIHKISKNKNTLRLVWSDVYTPLIGYVLITGLTVFNAVSLGAWMTEWLKWLFMLLLVILVLDMGQNRRWQWIILALVLAGVANALVGIYIFFGGSGALHLLVNNRFFRAFGTFGQPNPFGGFMGLIAPFAIMSTCGYTVLLWRRWISAKKISWMLFFVAGFYGISSILISAGLFLSWSRGAWLGFAVSVMVMLLASPRRLWQGLLLVVMIIGLLFLLWTAGYLPETVTERVASATEELFVLSDVRDVDITNDNYAIVERLAHWQAALNMAEHNPFLGVGFGNYEVAYEQYRLLNWQEPLGHAHNYYLNVLAETGIIGLIGYIAVFVNILFLTWRTRIHPDWLSRCLVVALLGSWSYLLIHSLTDNLYVNNIFIHTGVMFGILAVFHREVSKSKKVPVSIG